MQKKRADGHDVREVENGEWKKWRGRIGRDYWPRKIRGKKEI